MANNKSMLRGCMILASILFTIGSIIAIVGVVALDWMHREDHAHKVRVGLFEVCTYFKYLFYQSCVETKYFPYVAHEAIFIIVRILVITGIAAGPLASLAGFTFVRMIRMGGRPTNMAKVVFITTMVFAIGSAGCMGYGLMTFATRIYFHPYELKRSFILACVGAGVNVFACAIFAGVAVLYMAQSQEAPSNQGIALAPIPIPYEGYNPQSPYTIYTNGAGHNQELPLGLAPPPAYPALPPAYPGDPPPAYKGKNEDCVPNQPNQPNQVIN